MCSLYKNKDLLKNQPFHSEEIKSAKKNHKEILSFYLNYHFFKKNLKNLLLNNYQMHYHSNQKDLKDLKD